MSQPDREDAIVDAALEMSPEQRAAYLDAACGGDARLRGLVEGLLRAHGKFNISPEAATTTSSARQLPNHCADCGSPLPADWPQALCSRCALEGALEATVGEGAPSADYHLPEPLSRIGPYKILQQIGEGGCGVVYLAEQEQPLRRRVALKVIKLGMDTKAIIARFEAERQALALMDHPNIAKVLDAGATETGRPYFVMELVKGIRITDYCDQNHLPTEDRLNLFTQVCQAIQHAHQKGIIHRDIKPSNILVSLHDGAPVPKVIDFGIAKATDQRLTDKTIFTAFDQFIGTPAYMSPEQAELSGLDIDTRSDIYSLGVLLYELLTGKTPFDAAELIKAGIDEMRRIIREKDPVRPSTRLSTLNAEEQTTVAKRRQVEPPKLVSLVRGDLDWIAMKCLEKDRTRRYETASGLADDIRRHLDNEPVLASAPGNLYRLGKLVRRNRLAFAAAGAVVAALILGLGLSTWLFFRERQARRIAIAAEKNSRSNEKAARQSEADSQAVLRFFTDKLLKVAGPKGQSGGLGRDITLRSAIDAAEASIANSFSNRPIVEADIRSTLGETFAWLGDTPAAIKQLELALKIFEAERSPSDPDTLTAKQALSVAYSYAGKLTESIALAEQVLKVLEQTKGEADPEALTTAQGLGISYWEAGRYDDAIVLLQKTLKLRARVLGVGHPYTITSMEALGMVYSSAGCKEEASALLEQACHMQVTNSEPNSPDTVSIMGNLARAYMGEGRASEALPLNQAAIEQNKILYGATNRRTFTAMHNLAETYRILGDCTNAISLHQEVLQLRRHYLQKDHPHTMYSMHSLGRTYEQCHRLEEALTFYLEAVVNRREKLGPGHPETVLSMNNLALLYKDLNQASNAVFWAEETAKFGASRPDASHYLHTLTVITDWKQSLPSSNTGLSATNASPAKP